MLHREREREIKMHMWKICIHAMPTCTKSCIAELTLSVCPVDASVVNTATVEPDSTLVPATVRLTAVVLEEGTLVVETA